MNEFLNSIKLRDPAAKSILSIILTYPGVKAVFFHKISNFFFIAGFDLVITFEGLRSSIYSLISASVNLSKGLSLPAN